MKLVWLILGLWTLANTSVVAWAGWNYIYRECDWCHKRYIVWRSTSSAKNVFCSYTCNYWDMRNYLAEEMKLDVAEVEDYLSRRGYMHPDLMGVRR